MTNYILDGHDLSDLFDTRRPSFSFKDNPRHIIPNKGSIIYSVWDGDEQFIYIGISGLQKSLNRRNPISRMQSHASGRRSGDQFCIYIHDIFVIPGLIKTGEYESERGWLDKVTQKYIHDNLRYRFVSFLSDDSDGIVRKLENKIKKGDMGFTPKINGIDV
jgi:hypothetical protein